MLVATSGHIDHGKTSLIRALTGAETDRLPEERRRGISIDLGFAYWIPPGGKTIGFVDVPGHERFIRNMVAGVGSVDFALLVVAADDGVMPQTIEHLRILELLGVSRGFAVITKCDRSSRERIDQVRHQLLELLASSELRIARTNEVSSVTGSGITELSAALAAESLAEAPRKTDGRNFRLTVDRVFSVTGAGTVVTGCVLDGTVEIGRRLMISPRGLEVRVRGMQSAGKPVDRVQAGERCALNIAGADVAAVHRGDWLLVPEMHAPTSRLEAQLRILSGGQIPLRHNSPVHLYLGTSTVAARVLLARQAALSPGREITAQLALERPLCAATGDRLIIRDQSGRHLLGGGRVIDPFWPTDRRKFFSQEEVSMALRTWEAATALRGLLVIPGYEVNALEFRRRFNLTAEAAEELCRRSDAAPIGTASPMVLPAARLRHITEQLLENLRSFHRDNPGVGGLTPPELKATLTIDVSRAAFSAILKSMLEGHLLESAGPLIKLPGHTIRFSAIDSERWRRLLPKLRTRGTTPFTVAELAGELHLSEAAVIAMLFRRRSNGDVYRITRERFMLRQQLAALAATAAALTARIGGRGFTAAQFRDAIGTGRTLAIQVLEFFDEIGVTRRIGDLRKTRPDFELVIGAADPYVPPAAGGGPSVNLQPSRPPS